VYLIGTGVYEKIVMRRSRKDLELIGGTSARLWQAGLH